MAGTKFYNCDFHIHTPSSKCYKDKSATSKLIVQAALDKKLSAIAITDHNTFEGIQSVIDAAKDTGLVIFPGFELTTQGGHLLAIFDPITELAKLDDALTSCGITKDKRGSEEAIGKPFSEALKIIVQDYNGIAIAAHADGPKGFLKTIAQGQLNISIYKDKNLLAMELIDPENRAKYSEGKDPNYARPMACIQSSDAHRVEDIGLRSTLLKMHHISADGVLQAFQNPTIDIEFPDKWEPMLFPYVESFRIDKGFLSGQVIEFNPNFNCILGGAGSGKSTIIEFLRFAFDQVSDNPEIQNDCYGKLTDLATLGATLFPRLRSGKVAPAGQLTNKIRIRMLESSQPHG